ncbi:hypothetical protein R7R52_08210 [Vibrio sp. 665]|uniref:hypothetical protein n=3 Tax=Vibrionaceae TaxID=641 RepID=UPI002022F3BE|nr:MULTISPECIES: hypothetical protein [Vibrio]MDW1676095.1 hypothetical protein [Vibrio sp. Vb5029]MDW2020642.1 hypothetical protein [Vibrio sp. 397]MCR9506898.1 hypothetical protein [Vibrio alginolyticus]MDW2025494.1 hypothetical protein [Vibrio sp. 399]MDW2031972.1 hypothetical protein [Vibrio sp. 665]
MMNNTMLLSTRNFVYRARVKAVCDASDESDGMSTMSIDSSFHLQIEAINCTNAEFAKRFFAIHGEGHLEGDEWLVLYVNSLDVKAGDNIEIRSDVAFNAMIENMISEAERSLEKVYLDAIRNLEKVNRF